MTSKITKPCYLFLLIFTILTACATIEPQQEIIASDTTSLEPIAKTYLLSQIGNDFEQDINPRRNFSINSSVFGGCNQYLMPQKDGEKIIFEYTLDLSRHIQYDREFEQVGSSEGRYGAYWKPDVAPSTTLTIVFDENSQIYCTGNVIDCFNHPEFCPPFKINSTTKAIDMFSNLYPEKNINAARIEVYTPGSNFFSSPLNQNVNELRFSWTLAEIYCGHRECGETWTAHIDPNTGKEITENTID